MIGLGLASSHAPASFRPKEKWGVMSQRRNINIPEPPQLAEETEEVIENYIVRIDAAFDILRRQIEDYQPEALIIVGDDQYDMFDDSNMPAFSIYTGDEIWGATSVSYLDDEDVEESIIRTPCHSELANYLLKGLIKKGFDPAYSKKVHALGKPNRGAGHALSFPLHKLVPNFDIPVIPIFLNGYFPPQPTGQRCWDYGVAIAEVMKDRPEKIAIYASGGLSHDPMGPRSGWIDEPLDRWVLERLEKDKSKELTNLFTFDSDTLRSGTGEIRQWITVAGAMDRKATVIDYIPAYHTKTGLGYVYWPVLD
ncbi:hypothetical protein [Bacillus sp. Marseille-P3661]|uniref:DODA-type extradiol aromatic ring-opening family dioxygenase n=1 Tax=Bacillus sp. Marseille-P3661 TaxID=1936234 RepID=UPI000C864B21|nr:hypothetical protein [Bacillus sp. Marseille-P3661]